MLMKYETLKEAIPTWTVKSIDSTRASNIWAVSLYWNYVLNILTSLIVDGSIRNHKYKYNKV